MEKKVIEVIENNGCELVECCECGEIHMIFCERHDEIVCECGNIIISDRIVQFWTDIFMTYVKNG